MEICTSKQLVGDFKLPGEPEFDLPSERPSLDEFVLDLTSFPTQNEFRELFQNEATYNSIYPCLDNTSCGDDVVAVAADLGDGSRDMNTSSGYESDREDDVLSRRQKKRRTRRFRPRDRSDCHDDGNKQWTSTKRKAAADDSLEVSHKRIKLSSFSSHHDTASEQTQRSSSESDNSSSNSDSETSSDFSSDSSSDFSSFSWSSSDSCSDSDGETGHSSFNPFKYLRPPYSRFACPHSCPCNAGSSKEPESIERKMHTPLPLYKKLLQYRLLGVESRTTDMCCKRRCHRKWGRPRPIYL